MDSQRGTSDLPRYWITLNKETIWDYPKYFLNQSMGDSYSGRHLTLINTYPYGSDISDISKLLNEYIDTPKEELLNKHFENDKWGLINILKAADRRIGERRLSELKRKMYNKAARKIINARINKLEITEHYKENK
jgi:hypothetical protein